MRTSTAPKQGWGAGAPRRIHMPIASRSIRNLNSLYCTMSDFHRIIGVPFLSERAFPVSHRSVVWVPLDIGHVRGQLHVSSTEIKSVESGISKCSMRIVSKRRSSWHVQARNAYRCSLPRARSVGCAPVPFGQATRRSRTRGRCTRRAPAGWPRPCAGG